MSFITWAGTVATDNYFNPNVNHIVLSHPSLADQLILAEHDEKPYEHYPIGWTQADGRSLQGALRLKGDNWKKDQWECNFHAQLPQVTLFNSMLQAQQDDALSVALADYWSNTPVVKQVWLQVDRQYLSLVAANSWWRLQFQAMEV